MNWLVAIASLSLACSSVAAPTPKVADQELVQRVERVLEVTLKHPEAVGLTVAVARGDRILLERGAGIADLEFDVPADAQTLFRIGSLTKQFTAAAIMRLVERGQLQLDDDLNQYVPSFDSGGRSLTIRQLLH